MSKKILSILLAVLMVLSIAPFSVFAEDDILSYLTYEIVDGEVIVKDCDESISGDVVIPDTIDGYTVTSIGSYSFAYCDTITSITIPDSVTSINYEAFYGCTSLTSIIIPDSVTEIGYAAFNNCTSLTEITIPDSVTSIGSSAFSSCTSLTEITIPDSVTEIGYRAFEYCTSLTEITIPDSVTSIGDSAFSGCANLTSITIPDSVTSIGYYAFNSCESLTEITIPDSVISIGNYAFDDTAYYNDSSNWENGVLYIDNHLIKADTDISECTIKEGILTISDCAFYDCSALTNVTIPDSITSIGSSAFSNCSALTSITIPDSVTSIGDYAFFWCDAIESVYIESIESWFDISFGDWFSSPLGNGADLYVKGTLFTELTFPDDITNIGTEFSGCTSLTNVIIPDSVTSIARSAFSGCESLTAITIPDGVTSISIGTFLGCTSLKEIAIPDSVTSIGGTAFAGCESLTEVTIPDSVTSIVYSAFEDCTSLTEVTIPDSVISIGEWAFRDCTSLTEIAIPDSVTSIGEYAFGYYYDYETWEQKLIDGVTIYGYSGSAAETYANDNGINFVAFCEVHMSTVVKDSADATCVSDGYTGDTYCNDCKMLITKGEVVSATGHTEEIIPEVPATYKETGLTEGKKCSVCNEVLVAQEVIPILEKQDLKPSTENITVKDSVATVIPEMDSSAFKGNIENENVQILDKDGNELTTDAFVGTGSKINVLDTEGKVLSTYEVMVKSDVDGNGKVTPADARLALRAAAGLDTIEGVYETAANFDEQDTISTSDARMILRKAAGLE